MVVAQSGPKWSWLWPTVVVAHRNMVVAHRTGKDWYVAPPLTSRLNPAQWLWLTMVVAHRNTENRKGPARGTAADSSECTDNCKVCGCPHCKVFQSIRNLPTRCLGRRYVTSEKFADTDVCRCFGPQMTADTDGCRYLWLTDSTQYIAQK